MAIVVGISEGKRLKFFGPGIKVHGTASEASLCVAVIDIYSPTLKRYDKVRMTVPVKISHRERPAWHGLSWRRCGERRVEFPVSLVISEIDFDSRALVSHQDQLQMAVPLKID